MQNNLQPSAACLALIRRFEGCSLVVYRDAVGVATTGWGHKLLPDEMTLKTITQAEADAMLQSDALVAAHDVNTDVIQQLNQNQFDACVSLFFNIGGPQLSRSRLLRYINAGDFVAVPAEWALWCHAGARVLPGLVARRTAELALFLS
jgi:lysozyme